MKNTKYIIAALLVVFVGIGVFLACQKENRDNKNNNDFSTNNLLNRKAQTSPDSSFVILKATIRRAIYQRPRDNKVCDCENCFGLCDIQWFPTLQGLFATNEHQSPILMKIDVINSCATLYILQEKDYFETEFGVDNSITIPSEALENTNFESITINEGLYEFNPQLEEFEYESNLLNSYGSIIVNIDIVNKSN